MPTVKTLLIWSSFKIIYFHLADVCRLLNRRRIKPDELPDLPDAWYFMGAEMVINKEKIDSIL